MQVLSDSGQCLSDLTGWQFALLLPDGGAMPLNDGGPSYDLSYSNDAYLPTPSLTATTSSGIALLFDIATGPGTFVLDARYTGTDAGPSCAPLTEPLEFTGQLEIGPGIVTVAPIALP